MCSTQQPNANIQTSSNDPSCTHIKQKVLEDIQCPICLDTLSDPRILPCGHSYCGADNNCLKMLRSQITCGFKCAICNAVCAHASIDQIPKNFAMKSVLESLESVSGQTSIFEICSEHNCVRKFFCETCDCTVCDECLGTSHRGHVVELYEKRARRKMPEMGKSFERCFKFIQSLSTSLGNIRDSYTNVGELLTEVENHVEECMIAGRKISETSKITDSSIESYEKLASWVALNNKKDLNKLLSEMINTVDYLRTYLNTVKPGYIYPPKNPKAPIQSQPDVLKREIRHATRRSRQKPTQKLQTRNRSISAHITQYVSPQQQLGERLHSVIVEMRGSEIAGKLTSKLLEMLDLSEIQELVVDHEKGDKKLLAKVGELLSGATADN